MRRTLLTALFLAGLGTTPTLARERCDLPGEDGFHFKVVVGFGERSYETQQQFDMMALRKAGVYARSSQRTSDGCIEAWIPNGDGTFRNEYYDPSTLGLGGTLKLNLD